MTVNEILDYIATLGVGLDNPTSDDQDVFLKYLNLAHYELFRKTASVNPKASTIKEIVNCDNGVLDALSNEVQSVKKVYLVSGNIPLIASSQDLIQELDPGITKQGTPREWYYQSNRVHVYPLFSSPNPQTDPPTGQIGVWYVKEPVELTFNTLESDIPYPVSFHPILIDGACYYLFQGDGAFKDGVKMQTALSRWHAGKTELFSYLIALSGKTYYSTFTRV